MKFYLGSGVMSFMDWIEYGPKWNDMSKSGLELSGCDPSIISKFELKRYHSNVFFIH